MEWKTWAEKWSSKARRRRGVLQSWLSLPFQLTWQLSHTFEPRTNITKIFAAQFLSLAFNGLYWPQRPLKSIVLQSAIIRWYYIWNFAPKINSEYLYFSSKIQINYYLNFCAKTNLNNFNILARKFKKLYFII